MSKIVRKWNDHLEIFSLPQVIENSRQYLVLRTTILQKIIVGFPLKVSILRQREMWFPDRGLFIGFAFQARIWVISNCGLWKEVTFCVNSICVLPINHRKSLTFLEKLVILQPFSLHTKNGNTNCTVSCANQEYNTISELTHFMLKRSVFERLICVMNRSNESYFRKRSLFIRVDNIHKMQSWLWSVYGLRWWKYFAIRLVLSDKS